MTAAMPRILATRTGMAKEAQPIARLRVATIYSNSTIRDLPDHLYSAGRVARRRARSRLRQSSIAICASAAPPLAAFQRTMRPRMRAACSISGSFQAAKPRNRPCAAAPVKSMFDSGSDRAGLAQALATLPVVGEPRQSRRQLHAARRGFNRERLPAAGERLQQMIAPSREADHLPDMRGDQRRPR